MCDVSPTIMLLYKNEGPRHLLLPFLVGQLLNGVTRLSIQPTEDDDGRQKVRLHFVRYARRIHFHVVVRTLARLHSSHKS
jgi:hypothetical protein